MTDELQPGDKLHLEASGVFSEGRLDPDLARRPKQGDRFLHKRHLRPEARPPYGEDDRETCVVTAVRDKGTDVIVFYTTEKAWRAGHHHGDWYFRLDDADISVRRWLLDERSS